MSDNLKELDYLAVVAAEDVEFVEKKNRSYGGSWKRRGGVGAFMMLARKWDRLENILSTVGAFGGGDKDAQPYDIFQWIRRECENEKEYRGAAVGQDGSVLAEIRDLRRYLLLVEAEMMARGVIGGESEPVKRTVAADQKTLAAGGGGRLISGTAGDNGWCEGGSGGGGGFRVLSPNFERVISGGFVHEVGQPPRPSQGYGTDGELIRIGDACTCNPPGNDPVFDTKLIDVQPVTGRPIIDYGEAPGGLVTDWNRLRRQSKMTAERRVPRYDAQRTPEDGAQHSGTAPHVVVGETYFEGIDPVLREKFWCRLTPTTCRLEPWVHSPVMPKCLQGFYDLTDQGWVLRMSRVPKDARSMFPKLEREKNRTELSELPSWQQSLYEWNEQENKWILRERDAAWAVEE